MFWSVTGDERHFAVTVQLADDGQTGNYSGPEVGFGEIAIDLPNPFLDSFRVGENSRPLYEKLRCYADHPKYLFAIITLESGLV